MVANKRVANRRVRKASKTSRGVNRARVRRAKKKSEVRRPPVPSSRDLSRSVPEEPPGRKIFAITAENIRGDTAIGDLLVFFPRTREVLAKRGLRLEAESAGDIYMTIDAFAAMNSLETESLVQEIVVVAREPLPQQPATQLASPQIP